MGVTAAFSPPSLEVDPGGSASCEVRVKNTGRTADEYVLTVLGEAAAWTSLFPRSLAVPARREATARLVVHLPRASHPPPGPWPLQLEVVSARDQRVAEVVEASIEVRPFTDAGVTLVPRISASRTGAEHDLVLENLGNTAVRSTVSATGGDSLTVDVDPGVLTAGPGEKVVAKVRPRARRSVLFPGRRRACPFQVVAHPEGADPVRVDGTMYQEARLPAATLWIAAGLVLLLLAGVLLRLTVLSPSPAAEQAQEAGAPGQPAPGNPGCVAEGHTDPAPLAHGDDAVTNQLPADYSFFNVSPDGCRPARANPCEPVHWVLNPALAPRDGPADAHEAIRRLAEASGLNFVFDGNTTEQVELVGLGQGRTQAVRVFHQPQRYGNRWAPWLVTWARLGRGEGGRVQAAGGGAPHIVNGVIVSGVVVLNVEAVTDTRTQEPVRGGFRAEGMGIGPIGPKGVTWGRVLLHELGHVAGLGHARNRAQLMHPEATAQISRAADYASGDRAGLRLLGRESGCLRTPPPGTAPTEVRTTPAPTTTQPPADHEGH